MKALSKSIGVLVFLLVVQAMYPVPAQETRYQVLHVMELPPELNQDRLTSCSLEFQEEWSLDPAGSSITKSVHAFAFPCTETTEELSLPEGAIRIKNLSFEFSFLDLPDQQAKKIQMEMIALINKNNPLPEVYDASEQLLSVYFHEDWTIESGHRVFTKRVRAITPVIWQRRQTAEGEPLLDPDTGYPVFYKLNLQRIELRRP